MGLKGTGNFSLRKPST